MTDTPFRVSIEEQAYGMGLLGGFEPATAFLLALLGSQPAVGTEGRLLAAAHSLAARDLLRTDPGSGTPSLDPAYAAALRPLIQPAYQLRCSRSAEATEQVWSYYVDDGRIIRHGLLRDGVVELRPLPDTAALLADAACHFGVSRPNGSGVLPPALGYLESSALEAARQLAAEQGAPWAAAALRDAGLAADTAADLAADLAQHRYRASVVRIERNRAGFAERGALVLGGLRATWVFTAAPTDPRSLAVLRGAGETFMYVVADLAR